MRRLTHRCPRVNVHNATKNALCKGAKRTVRKLSVYRHGRIASDRHNRESATGVMHLSVVAAPTADLRCSESTRRQMIRVSLCQEMARGCRTYAERSPTRPGSKLPIEEQSGTDGRSVWTGGVLQEKILADGSRVLHFCIRPVCGANLTPGHHGYARAIQQTSGKASMGWNRPLLGLRRIRPVLHR